jgi:glucose dehydrogenase
MALYDPDTNAVWWGTGNPAPLYAGRATTGRPRSRPGDNLYVTSVILLDADTGALKSITRNCRDAWDFDSSMGEFVFLERDGKSVMHPKRAASFVYDRNCQAGQRLQGGRQHQLRRDIKPDGTLVGRRDLSGKHKNLCPAIAGGLRWNAGTYNPKTGLWYRVGYEWCIDLEVVKTEPVTEPVVQLNIGANFTFVAPEGDKLRGHIRARDPITGKVKFEIAYPGAIPRQPALDWRKPAVRTGSRRHPVCI